MRAPAAMALFKTKEKCRGRARFVAAALQKASVCTPKLGYRTSITGVLRGSPAGLRRARAFSAMAPPVRLGDFAQGPTRARTLCFPVQKKTRFKPLVRKWYRLVSALSFPLCRLSYTYEVNCWNRGIIWNRASFGDILTKHLELAPAKMCGK
jgi:hypothetical protein